MSGASLLPTHRSKLLCRCVVWSAEGNVAFKAFLIKASEGLWGSGSASRLPLGVSPLDCIGPYSAIYNTAAGGDGEDAEEGWWWRRRRRLLAGSIGYLTSSGAAVELQLPITGSGSPISVDAFVLVLRTQW